MQNVAKFRLIVGLLVPQPSTYDKWQICPLFSNLAQYVRMSLKEPLMQKKKKKVAVNDFVGSIWIQVNIFTPNVDQIIQDSDEIFLGVKNCVFLKNDPRLPYLMSLM